MSAGIFVLSIISNCFTVNPFGRDTCHIVKDNESNDYRAGNSHNSKCPPNDSLTWRGGYKVGYEVGWVELLR